MKAVENIKGQPGYMEDQPEMINLDDYNQLWIYELKHIPAGVPPDSFSPYNPNEDYSKILQPKRKDALIHDVSDGKHHRYPDSPTIHLRLRVNEAY